MKKTLVWATLLSAVLTACKDSDDPIDPKPNPDPEPEPITISHAGWPNQYDGVMLQGFYWDSYTDTQWQYLESKADDIAPYFSLIWIPNSGNCGNGNNMGYLPLYYFNQNSSFGSEDNLRSMIKTYKDKGTGMIADVVVNHHQTEGWFGFPAETYNGEDYSFKSTDICSDDDGGKAATQARTENVSLSGSKDTGEGWDGARDLDHISANVQRIVKAYTKYLLEDLGYAGFRYDMVKGYSASYTGMYNAAANPMFSVGEYWDGNATAVQNWITGTTTNDSIQSAAFDFCFRYTCRDAANGKWSALSTASSATSSAFNRYAVTFIENHDTEYRSATAQQDPIKKDTLALNAWLLANPGTPCVFYKHWQAYKKDIKLMIEARKLVGVTNVSKCENISVTAGAQLAARKVTGKNGQIIVVAGPASKSYTAPAGFTELLSGYHYRYLVSSDCDQSGWESTVARINEEEKTEPFTPHTATIYVKADFTPVYFYVWDSNNNSQLNGNWPGKQITEQVEVGGVKWYTQSFDINSAGYYFNIIFNQGSGKPQTTDIGHLDSDHFYEATISGGNVVYTDVTSNYLK